MLSLWRLFHIPTSGDCFLLRSFKSIGDARVVLAALHWTDTFTAARAASQLAYFMTGYLPCPWSDSAFESRIWILSKSRCSGTKN